MLGLKKMILLLSMNLLCCTTPACSTRLDSSMVRTIFVVSCEGHAHQKDCQLLV